MQIRNRYYSYPVMVEDGEYYEENTFESSVAQQMEGYNVKLLLDASLQDVLLRKLIDAGEVVIAHHIECPQTCFRKIIKTKDYHAEVLLRDTEVNGIVQVCTFLVAAADIEKYSNDSFNKDYAGWKFNIEKGCIMGVANQYNLRINKIRDDFANTSSIFSIVKNTDPTADTMGIDLRQQKIIVTLPEITHNQYKSVENYIDVQPVMHSMIIIPALIYIFSELKSAKDQLYEYEDYRWFRSLRKACKAIDISLDEEGLEKMDIVKVSQMLLSSPVTKAVSFCAMGGGCSYW